MNLAPDLLEKALEGWSASAIALEAAARERIDGYEPFSMTGEELKRRLQQPRSQAKPLLTSENELKRLRDHATICELAKMRCNDCAQFYDLAGHDTYMDTKWRRDESKTVCGIDRTSGRVEIAAPFQSIIEAVLDAGMGLTQYAIISDKGKAYVTLDKNGRVHSQDLRALDVRELPILMGQIAEHFSREST